MSELAGQVRAALAEHRPGTGGGGDGQPMGLFTAPFRPASGPLAGHVLKPYRIGRDPELLEPLLRRHEAYLDCLRRAGLGLPETRLILIHEHGTMRPVVVQEAVPPEALLSGLLRRAALADALAFLDEVAGAVCGFWASVAQRPERIGLHASVQNFALDAAVGTVFLDSFPPLIGQSREEMGRLIHRFSDSGLIRGIGRLLPGRVREIQDPWYTLPGNLALLTEGALRLRPQDTGALLDWAQDFAAAHLQASDRAAFLAAVTRPRPRHHQPFGEVRTL
ncbi:MAG: DUF6206 family protein, partial [Roseicyclus sp.]